MVLVRRDGYLSVSLGEEGGRLGMNMGGVMERLTLKLIQCHRLRRQLQPSQYTGIDEPSSLKSESISPIPSPAQTKLLAG